MKILLIVLAVLAAVFVLLFLLLFFGCASIRITYREQLRVVLNVLGLRFRLYPEKAPTTKAGLRREAKRKRRQRLRKAEKRMRKQKRAAAGEPTPNLPENLQMIWALVKLARRKVKGKLFIRVYRFDIRIATGDAAKTAILYGATVGAAAPLLQWINADFNTIERESGNMSIRPDFLAEKSSVDIDLELGMKIFRGLIVAGALLSAYRDQKELAIQKARRRIARKAARARAKALRKQQKANAKQQTASVSG